MTDIAAIEARIGSDYQPMGVAKAFVTAARDATDLLAALRAAEAREARLPGAIKAALRGTRCDPSESELDEIVRRIGAALASTEEERD